MIVQLWAMGAFASNGLGELGAFLRRVPLERLFERMSQLHPAAFKSPWPALYVAAFLATAAGTVLFLWARAIKAAGAAEAAESIDA